MGKGLGLAVLALVSAAAGAAATVYALKKKNELDQYNYDFEDEDSFFDDCDCGECTACQEEAEEAPLPETDEIPEEALDGLEDPVEDVDQPSKKDL